MATLRDVARLAGVSLATASRALNGRADRPAARETQKRVLAAVRQLNYMPGELAQEDARSVGKRASGRGMGNIGLILGTVSYKFTDPFWSAVLDGVNHEVTRRNYHLRFAFTLDDLGHEHQRSLINRTHVDGIVLVGGHDSAAALASIGEWLEADEGRARTVIIEGGDERFYRERPLACDVVTFEKRYPMYHVVEHLIGLGRRRFAFLGPASAVDDRGAALLQALELHGIPFDAACYLECPWSTEGAYPVAQQLFAAGHAIDAVVCGCDAIAISAMRAAREAGLQLPHDIAITGFDDIEFAQYLHPPLTTVRVAKEQLGSVAVRKLIERLTWPDLPPVVQVVPSTLVVRESCGETLPHAYTRFG